MRPLPETVGEFSLLGGPTHRIGCRLGLVRNGTNTIRLGLALGLISWIVLASLALIDAAGDRFFSLPAIAAHLRLLVAIPLFFVCESLVDPRMTAFVRTLVRSGVVPPSDLPALESDIARTARWKNSSLSEAAVMLAALAITWAAPFMPLAGATASHTASGLTGPITLSGAWYWAVCLTLFRFLLLRWLWRIGVWSYLLWRISRLRLHLVATHPDQAAGLGYLEVVQTHFTPLILAISVVQSASIAEEMSSGAMPLASMVPALWPILVLDAVMFVGPLFIFAVRLWRCRVQALCDYMELASSYVEGFEKKWLVGDVPPRESLLGSPDVQSLADLANSLDIVRGMRWAPVSRRLLLEFSLAALIPMLPLLLFQYPAVELARLFFERLAGL